MKKTHEHIFDELLVMQHLAGNKKALSVLVNRWAKRLVQHAYRFTKNMEASKDIAQDSWEVIFNKIESLKDPALFGIWALSIVSKKSVNWVRNQQKLRNRNDLFQTNANQENVSSENSNDTITSLKKEIQKLSEKQQVVLKLFYTENYSIAEICAILSLPSGTVKSRLFNAREQLKQCITKK